MLDRTGSKSLIQGRQWSLMGGASSAKSVPTRQAVDLLKRDYLDFMTTLPTPDKPQQTQFLTEKINNIFKDKLENTTKGKAAPDIIKKFTDEVGLLGSGDAGFKDMVIQIANTLMGPATGIADINPPEMRPPVQDFFGISDIRDRVVSIASEHDGVQKIADKLDAVVNPPSPSMSGKVMRGAELIAKAAVMGFASMPVGRSLVEAGISNWTQSISMKSVFPPDSESTENKKFLIENLRKFGMVSTSTLGAERIDITQRNLEILKMALAGVESKMVHSPDNMDQLKEEATLYRQLSNKFQLRLAVQDKVPSILNDVLAINQVLPVINVDDLDNPVKMGLKLIDGMKTNPELRVALRDVFKDQPDGASGLKSVLEKTMGAKVVTMIQLALQDESIQFASELLDTLSLDSEESVKLFLYDPAARLLSNDTALSQVITVSIHNLAQIVGNPENIDLLSKLSKADDLEAFQDIIGMTKTSNILGRVAHHIHMKLGGIPEPGTEARASIDRLVQRFTTVSDSLSSVATIVDGLVGDGYAPDVVDYARHQSPASSWDVMANISDLVQAGIGSASSMAYREVGSTMVSKEILKQVNKLIYPNPTPEEKVPIRLDRQKVMTMATQSMMLTCGFIAENPKIAEVIGRNGIQLANDLSELLTQPMAPDMRQFQVSEAVQDFCMSVGCALSNTNSPAAQSFGRMLSCMGDVASSRLIQAAFEKSRVFDNDSISRIKYVVDGKASSAMRAFEEKIGEILTKHLSPPISPLGPLPAISDTIEVPLSRSMLTALNGDGFMPKGYVTRGALAATGMGAPMAMAHDTMLSMVADLRV